MSDGNVSVVVVTYRNDDLSKMTARVLSEPEVAELILVDNGNGPATEAWLRDLAASEPRVRLVSGHGNVGFGAGCNLGAVHSSSEYLLLLNPDCQLEPGSLRRVLDLLAGKGERWLAGVRLLNPDGTEQKGARRNVGTPAQWVSESFGLARFGLPPVNRVEEPLPASPTPVDAISGAFMLMPRQFWQRLGGMDERYFLHFEDLDFCLRAHKAGGEVFFVPNVVCYHQKGQSRVPDLWLARQKIKGMRTYFFTNFRDSHSAPLLWAVCTVLGAGLMAKSLLARLTR